MLSTAILVPICFCAKRSEPLPVGQEQLAEVLDIAAQSERAEVDERLAEGRAS